MIKMDIRGIEEAKKALKNTPEQAQIAIARALNRAAKTGRSQMARSTTKRYRVKHAEVLKTMKVLHAHRSRLNASISSKGRALQLVKFVKVSSSGGKGSRPVTVSVRKGKSKKIAGAFVAKGRENNLPNVLSRTTKKRYPLKTHQTIAIPVMIGSEGVMPEVEAKTQEMLEKRIAHELNFALGGNRN